MIDIITPRVYIPRPTGCTLQSETFGIKALGKELCEIYNKLAYDNALFDESQGGRFKNLYALISERYNMDLTVVPKVNPYIAWVVWCKKNGGGVAANDTAKIEEVKRNCNTLIIPNHAEREYLYRFYDDLRMMYSKSAQTQKTR